MLAFLVVILVAVGTVALLSGWVTATEFRRYASYGGRWEQPVAKLADYYSAHNSWEGVPDTLQPLPGQEIESPGRGMGRGGTPTNDFQVTDAAGRVVGSTMGSLGDTLSQAELTNGIPIPVKGRIVGYLIPAHQANAQIPPALDIEQTQFLERVRAALWIAALAAAAVALIIGGLLFRSVVTPLHRLTLASQTIAEGDLSIRAPIQGQDEVAQLAAAFNRMTDSLTQAESARRNQIADISHELRTPLTVLRGTLEAMLDGIYPTDRDNLLATQAQVHTLTRLVEDLRLLALADAGQLSLYTDSLDIVILLRETVANHQLQAQERDVRLTLETPPSPKLVLADRDRLIQVLGNLLSNALRYVPAGGLIAVQVKEQRQKVIVTIADDGPGIAAEDLPHLFDRFWRGDRARRQATGGSGLGLTIARQLIEAHGGHLWAQSVEGEGSTFAFALPALLNAASQTTTPGV